MLETRGVEIQEATTRLIGVIIQPTTNGEPQQPLPLGRQPISPLGKSQIEVILVSLLGEVSHNLSQTRHPTLDAVQEGRRRKGKIPTWQSLLLTPVPQ